MVVIGADGGSVAHSFGCGHRARAGQVDYAANKTPLMLKPKQRRPLRPTCQRRPRPHQRQRKRTLLPIRLLRILLQPKALQGRPARARPSRLPPQRAPEVPPAPDMSFPPGASKEVLLKVIATAKGFRPFNADQYKLQQTALRDASSALMKLIDNQEDPVRMQAELDVLSSNAALMTNESDEARDQVLEKIITYLKSRKQLSLADVQTGMIVGFYLELQPRKSPARDVYSTMVDLLEKDEREEMQALRINLQASVRRLEMLGNKLDLNVKTIDDKPIKTEDFAGKFVLVDFFATWCGPCIAEVPRLKRHYDKYREKGLEVVAISLDDDRQALDKYLEEAKLPWPVIHDSAPELSDKLQMKFGIASLPTVLFLNKEGVVVSLEARGAELDRLMERLFEMPTPAEPEPEAPKDNAKQSEVGC